METDWKADLACEERQRGWQLRAAAALLYCFDPAVTPEYPACLIRLQTGRGCPGCGATRAQHALLHGRVEEAWRRNTLWTSGASALAGWAAWRLLRGRSRRTEA